MDNKKEPGTPRRFWVEAKNIIEKLQPKEEEKAAPKEVEKRFWVLAKDIIEKFPQIE